MIYGHMEQVYTEFVIQVYFIRLRTIRQFHEQA